VSIRAASDRRREEAPRLIIRDNRIDTPRAERLTLRGERTDDTALQETFTALVSRTNAILRAKYLFKHGLARANVGFELTVLSDGEKAIQFFRRQGKYAASATHSLTGSHKTKRFAKNRYLGYVIRRTKMSTVKGLGIGVLY
jgi:hypothetical protein